MLIHNKRLHPRRPCEPGEHYHGCMLHEMQEQSSVRSSKSPSRSSKSPSRSRTPSGQFCSTTILNQKRQHSTSSSNSALYSARTSTPHNENKRNSIGAFPSIYDQINSLFSDVVDSPSKPALKSVSNVKQKSKSTICLSTDRSNKRCNTVTFKCYDSPDQIIANLFPGIDDKEPTFLRKGHGAAQMAKHRTPQKDWAYVGRSLSATGNYAATSDNRKIRAHSTSCDNSHRRLYSVEKEFSNLWCVLYRGWPIDTSDCRVNVDWMRVCNCWSRFL